MRHTNVYYSYQREYRKNNVNKMRLEHKTARNKSVENVEDEISKFIVSQGYRNYDETYWTEFLGH